MFRVFNCLTTEHDWRLVVLAGLICFLASLAAVSLFHRARATKGPARATWTATAGAAAGCGIWATHFIAMLAYDPGFSTAYDIHLTLLSLVVAIAITAAGLGVAIYTPARWGAAIGGGIVGAGVACMHYMGMGALEFPGHVTWVPELVAASIALGMLFGTAALAVAVRWDSVTETVTAAGLLTVAVLSHHFTAMGAVEIVPDPAQMMNGLSLSPDALALTVAGAAVAILGAALVVAFADRRSEEKILEQNVRFDAALHHMRQGLLMFNAAGQLVLFNQRYLQMYGLAPDSVKLGLTLTDLLRMRKAVGTFKGAPDQYVAKFVDESGKFRGDPDIATFAGAGVETKVIELPDGRCVSITNQSMHGGGWVSTHSDITEMRHAERELDRTRAFLDTIVDNVPATLIVKNAHDRRYVLINRAGERFFGLPREDMIGRTSDEVFSKPDADAIKARDEELLQSTSEMFLKDHLLTTPRKGTRLVTTKKVAIRDEDGAPRYLVNVIEDVTDMRQAERELDRTRAFLDTVVENVPATLIVKNADDRRYVLINRAGEQLLGVSRDELIGKTAYDFYTKDVADIINSRDDELADGGHALLVDEHPVRTPRKGMRLLSTKRMAILGENGRPQYLLRVIEDVTERKRAEARIEHMARHDPLTDLPNRAAFTEHLATTLQRAAATKENFAVICLDLDRFKEVNDIFGHSVGDALLCEVADRLRRAVQGAFISRVGGDEFTVIVDGPQPSTAEALADSLVAVGAKEFVIEGHPLRVGVTIGVAIFPADGADATTLLGNADAALYRAKGEARGSIRFFEAEMDQRLRERRALQQDLRSAAGCGELELYYQPQALIGGEVIGFEALLRWHHPTRGMILPSTFVPIAEESGLIVAIGEWVLREACREAASWPQPLRIAINLSPVQFQHGDLPQLLHSVLLETGLAPGRLELEITESVLIGDFSRAVSILRRLKLLGVRIAMDDFGTGYSSLSYLQAFPFDKIKIDQTFISNLEHHPQSATIIRAVIGLGRGLDLPVLAEGVETVEQLEFLTREACDEVQGYLIGAPLPIADYAEMVGLPPATVSKLAAASDR